MNAAGQLGACLISNTVSSYSASFGKRRWQVDTAKTSRSCLNKHMRSFCPALYVYILITTKCGPVLLKSDHFHVYFISFQCMTMSCCQILMHVFFPPPQLQHCLPVYLLLPRAHSQSSGGPQHREPPPAAHQHLSGPAPPGRPGALLLWTEGSTQEPF